MATRTREQRARAKVLEAVGEFIEGWRMGLSWSMHAEACYYDFRKALAAYRRAVLAAAKGKS